jgi:uncharacterized protein (TIGR02118 family)
MFSVNVLYPNSDAIQFNMNYYLDKHIPMVSKLLGSALTGVIVQQGSGGAAPGSKAAYAVITVLRFASLESFQKAFGPHAPAITSDIVNFTNVEPTVQFCDVRLG